MWVLFLIVLTGTAVNSTTVYFDDQAACEAALKEMAPQLSPLLTPQQHFYLHCQPTRSAASTGLLNRHPRRRHVR